jgi:D-glycero-D-manno-heptose 1,7-bisphosphate phosphatase
MAKPYILLDRDGVINLDRVNYVYDPKDLVILPGVPEALQRLHNHGYGLVVITNQSGIAKGIYDRAQMHECHRLIQEACQGLIEAFYFAPGHPSVSESLSRKPGKLMFEKARSKFKFSPQESWMIGDKDRDLIPARELGMKTIQVIYQNSPNADYYARDLAEATEIILSSKA